MQERRLDRRLLCAELVEMIWRDQTGRECRRVANLEDISHYGACLQVETPILCGTPVSMRYDDNLLSGTIRYCLYQDLGYFLGLEFEESSRWSPRQFRPSHLLDVCRLVDKAANCARSSPQQNGPLPRPPLIISHRTSSKNKPQLSPSK
ncbi:MAG: hypothetical protein JOY62_04510 [Acidobacteriaceae bacterium]|nr:hypothetical protein [Acidobacteriaceae bacterium]MBV9779217.1 hypothetical protein [Acidobacteriaceae bacterium]